MGEAARRRQNILDIVAGLRQNIFQAVGFLNDADNNGDFVISVQAMRPIVEAILNSLITVVSCLPNDLRSSTVTHIENNIREWVEAEAEDFQVKIIRGQ